MTQTSPATGSSRGIARMLGVIERLGNALPPPAVLFAGLAGADGPTHHGVFDIAYLRHLPDIVLAAPKDGPELEAMVSAAIW